jgi:hypothetical protein
MRRGPFDPQARQTSNIMHIIASQVPRSSSVVLVTRRATLPGLAARGPQRVGAAGAYRISDNLTFSLRIKQTGDSISRVGGLPKRATEM